jgi:gluconate 2-dehydrogenase gamma chain
MSKHDEARRKFLVGAAVSAGAVAGAALVPDAQAQNQPATTGATPDAGHMMHAGGAGHGAFLNDDNLATVAAFSERIWPGAPGKPGAIETGVPNYIDLALAGAYEDHQDFYRRGLVSLDALCQKSHGKPFAQLSAAQQDDVIKALETNKDTGFTFPSAPAFFNTVRTHVMEGMFADPVYGGNKDFAGWRQVSFPGAQPVFTQADMQSKEAFTRAPMIGLQAQAGTTGRRG